MKLQLGGIKEGDYIVAIGDIDVKWSSHDQVVKLIKESGETLSLKLVTPMDKQNKVIFFFCFQSYWIVFKMYIYSYIFK